MRNLKRALSLALAAIMLLGMMVMGTSAVSIDDFTDSDAVQNVEAVTLTSGLGIFQGRTDGSFDPTAPVTRAEMAVIICKILHGADVSPDNFTGTQQFTDVPAWAEGYVNMCSALGIIAGRGNGIFDPDTTVTTVEAATMLLKALGYYVTVNDALGADWDLEVTSRANALKLYGDLTLNMRAPLTRDNVAELVYNTLFAQMVAFNDYRGQYVKNTNRDVVVTAGTDDEANTLAYNTFKLYVVEGIVMANGYTTKALAQSSSNNAQTTVMFTEDTDLNKDGRKEYSEGSEFDFDAATPLNLIGHNVKVYYTIERNAPVVYAITDQAVLTAVIEYDANTTRLAEAANDAGFKKNSILDVKVDDYKVNYDMDVTMKDVQSDFWSDSSSITSSYNNLDDKKLLLISNSGNLDLAGDYNYVIVLDQFLTMVNDVEERRGDIEYELKANSTLHSSNGDVNIPLYDGVEENDYVVATNIGLQDDVVVFYKANLVDATITRITGISDGLASNRRIVADGVTYIESSVWGNSAINNVGSYALDDYLTPFVVVDNLEEETLVLDEFGEMVGVTEVEKTYNYAYIAQYGVIHTTGSLNTRNRLTAHVFFANGTSGIYEVNSFDGLADTPSGFNPKNLDINPSFVDKFNEANGQNYTTGALGIWDVSIRSNGTIDIDGANRYEETNNGNKGTNTRVYASTPDVRLIQNHSTFVDQNNQAVRGDNLITNGTPDILYQNNNTVYFYVTGTSENNNYNTPQLVVTDGNRQYDDDELEVVTRVGIKNAFSFKNNDESHGEGVKQVFASKSGTRAVVNAVLIEGVELYNSDVYYYNRGSYHYSSAGVTYELYDMDGNLVEKTYADQDRDDAQSKNDGFYLAKTDDLEACRIDNAFDPAGNIANEILMPDGSTRTAWNTAISLDDVTYETRKGDVYYVVNDVAQYDDYVDNFFGTRTPQGNISDNVKIVDACNSGLDTVSKVVRALKNAANGAHSNLLISYAYSTKDYVLKAIYISKYDPDETEAPGAPDNGNRFFNDSLTATFSGNTLSFSSNIYSIRGDVTAASLDSASYVGATNVSATYEIQRYNIMGDKVGDAITRRTTTTVRVGGGNFSDNITLSRPSSLFYYDITVTVRWTHSGIRYTMTDTFSTFSNFQ